MRGIFFFAIIAILIHWPYTNAVDHSNFKTCDQSGFCKRNRNYPQNASPWILLTDSIQVTGDSLGVEANLKHEKNGAILKMKLYALLDDASVFNMHITELSSERARFEAKDALVNSIPKKQLQLISSNEKGLKVQFADKKYTAYFTAKPFRVDLYEGEILLVTGNERGLFRFEHFRHKPAASQDNEQQGNTQSSDDGEPMDGAWVEHFKSHEDSKPYGPMSVAMDISFLGASHVYGIPEHADSFALKDTVGNSDPYRLFNLDVFEYEMNSPMALYSSVPVMIAHSAKRTIGILWLNPSETWIDVQSATSSSGIFSSSTQNSKQTHWMSETGVIDLYIMLGPTPLDVSKQNAKLLGTPLLPPYYSIGHHQCRWNYFSQEEVYAVDQSFDEYNIPVDAIWLDIEYTDGRLKKYFTWDKIAFSDVQTMVANLTAKGRRLIAIIDPHLKNDPTYEVFREARDSHFFIKQKGDNAADYEGWCWPDASMYPDFTNPQVREWWATKYNPAFFPGFEGGLVDIWNDMNEPSVFNGPETTAPKDVRHTNGFEHRDVHNMYGFYMTQATHNGLMKYRPNTRPFILTRSLFAGSQRYCAVWTGDNMSKWDHLKATIPMLLSLNSVGVSFSGADVPGFFFNPESTELVVRWYQAAIFQPFFRAHAHIDTRRREPWTFDERTRTLIADAIKLRYTYLPYLYTAFYENTKEGLPIMRPLWMHFPEDELTFAIDQAHLLGNALLIQPVLQSDVQNLDVYLPGQHTRWLHVPTLAIYHGDQTHSFPVKIETIPYFQKDGTIVSRRERLRRAAALTLHDPLTLDVFADSHGQASGLLYLDDGNTHEYSSAQQFIESYLHFAGNKLSYEVRDGKLHFPVKFERIRFYDYLSKPRSAMAHVGDKQITLHFLYDDANHVLTLRKPDLPTDSTWTIQIS